MLKIKNFLWLVIINAFPICEYLIATRMKISNMCCLCNQNIENIDHIFKNCPFVQGIWDHIKFNCPTPPLLEGDFFFFNLGLKWCMETIKLIAKFSHVRWKKLSLSCGLYGSIEII